MIKNAFAPFTRKHRTEKLRLFMEDAALIDHLLRYHRHAWFCLRCDTVNQQYSCPHCEAGTEKNGWCLISIRHVLRKKGLWTCPTGFMAE